jgi:hypothetical protein
MTINKKMVAALTLSAFAIAGLAAVNSAKNVKHKNLKVLPQDISDQKLDSIMESYNKALGVNCAFCHKEVKEFKDSIDYVSDENPMKENAREMMRMTIYINKTHFYFDKTAQPEYLKVVNCKTCHRGEPFPAD